MYYAVFLFQQAGLGETSASLLANGLQGVILNIFTLPNMYYMDSWGRRRPMIIGGIGMGAEGAIVAPFLSEFVATRYRGVFTGALAGFFSFGFVAAALLGYFLVPTSANVGSGSN